MFQETDILLCSGVKMDMDSLTNLYKHREDAAWGRKKRHLPVTLVTGFLGAGKTTLLNHVLTNKHNLRIAAAVNDFAAINIDSQIVRGNRAHDGVVALTNGCLCCSISTEFEKAVWSLLQDADIGKIDYLMIETSGVSDPYSTIATLEREFGDMYRIRLDAVVTVVDSDDLYAKISQGGSIESAAADSQLKCADVVLLNKKDLLTDEELATVKKYIASYVPGVQVYACMKCAVPLNYIMEVQEVAPGHQLVSHEVTTAAYTISAVGGVMNAERHQRTKTDGVKAKDDVGHMSKDEFTSISFESAKPFNLGAFQHFLGSAFPLNISRMKGTVWFAQNRSQLYSFHMSGRQRYELAPSVNVGESLSGAFSVQLVAIGKGIDGAAIQTMLDNCVYDATQFINTPYADSATVITEDKRFELIEQPKDENCLPEYLDFRLTGCIEYGVSAHEAATIHGIDFNRMNSELVRRVNGSSGPRSLLPVMLSTGMQVCRYSLTPSDPLSAAWPLITAIAKDLIVEFYRAVGYCKCGM